MHETILHKFFAQRHTGYHYA
uniref:Uncharacterized protein n=1 Tax=Anguilla anguilla TaxID=7936 RepID=A0A0E9UW39_ANGAN